MARTLDRRTVLRGLLAGTGVSLGLPLLDAMLDGHGEALADGTALPDRFGVWFWGNGVRPEKWVPLTTGAGWTPNEETAPLTAVRDYVHILSGHEIKTATHPHHSGMTGVMTGKRYHQLGDTRDTIVSTFDGPSVDMIAAAHFEGLTPFRSLELGVTAFRGTDEGSTFQHLSHNGPNAPNPSEYDPRAVWARLFGAVRDPSIDYARRSVLDSVLGSSSALQRRLGARDRQRLDQYFDSVRTLETRLASAAGACEPVPAPAEIVEPPGREAIEEKNEVMSQLLALALACDLTRVFSVQFSTCGSGVVWWQVGASESLHYTCHVEPTPQPIVHAASTATMQQLTRFLEVLRDTPDGTGNLLDSASILATSELADGQIHSNRDFPLIIAGRGNGRLVGDRHVRSTSSANTSDVVLTALRGAGVDVAGFGEGAGYSDRVVSEILT